MKMLRLSLIASIAVAVAACSGGGSGSKSSVVSSSTGSSSGSTGSTQPVNPNPPAQPTAEYQGLLLSGARVSNDIKATSHTQANKLMVDGVEISLIPNVTASNITITSGSGWHFTDNSITSTTLAHAKYGFVVTQSGTSLFVIGKPTQEMPKSGTVTYNGSALIYRPADGKHDRENWSSQFVVDFATNKLDGVLSETSGTGLLLKADIEGNKFKGAYDGVYTEGGFFGTNASELSGIFSSESDGLIGAYGAKKSN